MQEPEHDVLRLLRSLDEAGVEFVLIGTLAMVLHGSANVMLKPDTRFDARP